MPKTGLFLVIFLWFSHTSFGQQVFSPVSIQGLGQVQNTGPVHLIGMGRVSAAYTDRFSFNLVNPASMAWIDQTIMDVSVHGAANTLSTTDASSRVYNAGLGHFAVAIPLHAKKNLVSLLGVKPYALSGYSTQLTDPSGIRFENYSFEGNLSTAFMSLAKGYRLHNSGKLSVGGTIGFLFGTHNIQREIQHPDAPEIPYVRTFETYFTRGATYDLGLHYRHTLRKVDEKNNKDSSYLDVGFALNRSGNSNVAIERYSISYIVQGGSASLPDTVVPIQKSSGNLRLPTTLSGGIMYTKPYKMRWGVGLKYQMWNNALVPWSEPIKYDYFELSSGIGYYINEPYDVGSNYLTRIEYRAGIRYFNSFATLNDNRVNGLGMNIGFGLPILKTSFSKLNFAFEYERAGNYSDNVLQDDNLRVYLGVTIGEKWFNRLQID